MRSIAYSHANKFYTTYQPSKNDDLIKHLNRLTMYLTFRVLCSRRFMQVAPNDEYQIAVAGDSAFLITKTKIILWST